MLASNLELLRHIHDEVNFILQYTYGKAKEEVINDAILSRAVIRSLEIIGEATKKLEDEFKTSHPQAEWKKMASTRDKLIHDYFGVDYEIVWDIIKSKLPLLQQYILEIFKELDNKLQE
jgi:uncharacterized protein with HEPN domain